MPCPSQPARAACHRLATHRGFEGAVLALILFNTLVMACDGYGVLPPVSKLTKAQEALRSQAEASPSLTDRMLIVDDG